MRLEEKLYNLIAKKYKKNDFEIRDLVKYDNHCYGIKFYTTDGGYLFDFNGNLKELSECIIDTLKETERNLIVCPFCKTKTLHKNLNIKCDGCGINIHKEQGHWNKTEFERIQLYEAGGKIANIEEASTKDFLIWFISRDGYEKIKDFDEFYFHEKIESLIENSNEDYIKYEDNNTFKDMFEEHLSEYVTNDKEYEEMSNSILGKMGYIITKCFFTSAITEQYINILKSKTVDDYINQSYHPDVDRNHILLEFSDLDNRKYKYHDLSSELENCIIEVIIKKTPYENSDTYYEEGYEEYCDVTFNYLYHIMKEYFENISLLEYLNIYKIFI